MMCSGEHSNRLQSQPGEAAATGAGVGAAAGGLAGLLVGLGALAIPGIGPVLAAGPLVAALGGAGMGAVAGGIIGSLTEAGIAEQDANFYAEGVRRGGTLLTVYTTDEMADRVAGVMNQFGPVDVKQRAEEWRQANWDTFDEGAEPFAFDRDRIENDRMHNVSPSDLEGARSYSDMETGTTPHPDAAESLYGAPTTPTGVGGFQSVEPRFRQHYSATYEQRGGGWGLFREAYRFGYDMADQSRFASADWDVIKNDMRREWEMQHGDQMWADYEGRSTKAGWPEAAA